MFKTNNVCASILKTLSLLVISIVVFSFLFFYARTNNFTRSVDNLRIFYDEQGAGKPNLVFVHCWCGDRTYWDRQADYFSKNYHVVTLDLAGHGESDSDRSEWRMGAFGNDVAAVVKKLDLSDVVLVGHSMGGAVIIEAAKKLRGRIVCLVGVDNFQRFERTFTEGQIDQFVKYLQTDYPENLKNYVRSIFGKHTDPALVQYIADDMALSHPGMALSAMRNLLDYRYMDVLKDIDVPVYCINSDRIQTDVRGNRCYTKKFEVRIMKGVGHFGMLEDPDSFNNHLQSIIDELK